MATNTPNYNLVKPDGNDVPDISVINSNMDKIDNQMKIISDGVPGLDDLTTQLAQIENKNPIYLTDYDNVDRSGVNSSTLGLSEAINDAISQRRKIKVPSGTYVVDESIIKNLDNKNLVIEGEADGGEHYTRLFWRGGEGTMFTFTAGRNVMFRDIEVAGYQYGVDEQIFASNSIAFKAQASLIFTNCKLCGFENIAVWDGGYYHKITNSLIENTGIAFKDFYANNLIFEKIKVMNVKQFLTIRAGTGPVYIDGCSFERTTDHIFQGLYGSYSSLLIIGSYFENYPDRTPPEKLGSSYESNGAIYGFGDVTLIGNTISTKGYKRFVSGNVLFKQVISLGNHILYDPTNSTLQAYIHHLSSLDTVMAHDIAYPSLTDVGTNTPVYISQPRAIANKESSFLYDPFTKEHINLISNWQTPVLSSGWAQNEVSANPIVSYRKNGAKVQIKGLVNGASATDGLIFTLPEQYRPSETVYKVSSTGSGDGVLILRVSPNGRVTCSMTGVNGVILDGLEFYLEQEGEA